MQRLAAAAFLLGSLATFAASEPSTMDLHSHTYCSDGLKSPEALVEQARAAGLRVFSITDHDSISCVERAQAKAKELGGPTILPGVEVSADGGAIHLLGLGVDMNTPALRELVGDIGAKRIAWMRQVLASLKDMGAALDEVDDVLLPKWNMERKIDRPEDGFPEQVTPEDVRANKLGAHDIHARIHGYFTSPDIAKALMQRGIVRTTQEAFDRFMRPGGFAGVPFGSLPFPDAIKIIHASGGVAVLAHPYTIYSRKPPYHFSGKSYSTFEEFADELLAVGLDGFEVFKPGWERHVEDNLRIGNIVAAWKARGGKDLLLTPGSDYHGYDFGGVGPKALAGIENIPAEEKAKLDRVFGHAR